ncbi:hypothetical protein ACIQFZ_29015 [Streptomyces sp. NPDC093064]|uniref:hypothetical protein n=1 Tax=Streptomyces sp. NPDC093064 TaxID=3366020 RepID=UPI00382845E3
MDDTGTAPQVDFTPPQPGIPDVPLHPPGPRSHPRHAHTFGPTLATHPLLTGLDRHDLDRLTADIRDRLDALPPKQRPQHRKLTTENIIWATVLDQRGLSCSLTAYLFRIGENQMRALIKQVRPPPRGPRPPPQADPRPPDRPQRPRPLRHARDIPGQRARHDPLIHRQAL